LEKAGVREPLYLTAVKETGNIISSNSKPESVDTIVFDKTILQKWNTAHTVLPETALHKVLLTLKNISYSYDDNNLVLNDINFSINEGERVALVGRNGAGKSTLAKLIAGFIKPSTGSIIYAAGESEIDLTTLSIKEHSDFIGYVMQNPNQMISFSNIFDEAAFALRNRKEKENIIKEKVYDALKICGLYPYRNWPVSALSYGQKKRLTIAGILVMGTKFIILDEPTAGQDLFHYTQIMEFIEKLRREAGITFLLITHDMHLMLEYTDKAIVLSDGKLLAIRKPSEVLSDDTLIHGASLKRTSLYNLAKRGGIENAESFIENFIAREEQKRMQTRESININRSINI
jgi:energy-coupling factor transport system ATP-binding protein